MSTIIPLFNATRAPRRGNAPHDESQPWGQILLFTGVRYEQTTAGSTPGKSGSPTSGRRARRG